MQLEARHGIEADEGAHHKHVTVGKVDQLDDTVDHGIAKGDHRVDETQLQAAEHDLGKQERVVKQIAYQDDGRPGCQKQESALANPRKPGSGSARGIGLLLGHAGLLHPRIPP